MKKLRLKEPYVTETPNSIIFHFEHTPLASPEEMVLEYLDTHDKITNSIARDLTGHYVRKLHEGRVLKLKKRDLIDRVPGFKGNKVAWQKVKK